MSYSDVDLRPAIQLDETTRGDFVVRVPVGGDRLDVG